MSRRAPQRLQWRKVERALRELGVDVERFLDAYDPTARLSGTENSPTEQEIRAVQRYQQNRDFPGLMRELGATDREAVERLIHRVAEREANPHVLAASAGSGLPERDDERTR